MPLSALSQTGRRTNRIHVVEAKISMGGFWTSSPSGKTNEWQGCAKAKRNILVGSSSPPKNQKNSTKNAATSVLQVDSTIHRAQKNSSAELDLLNQTQS